jgi:hypothetical protein
MVPVIACMPPAGASAAGASAAGVSMAGVSMAGVLSPPPQAPRRIAAPVTTANPRNRISKGLRSQIDVLD